MRSGKEKYRYRRGKRVPRPPPPQQLQKTASATDATPKQPVGRSGIQDYVPEAFQGGKTEVGGRGLGQSKGLVVE